MLAAVEGDEVIAGAYTDRGGRVCPILAAHRRGARTEGTNFARAWDGFTRAGRPRPARERELGILRAPLQESVADSKLATWPLLTRAPKSDRPRSRQAPDGRPAFAAARPKLPRAPAYRPPSSSGSALHRRTLSLVDRLYAPQRASR